MPLDPLASPSDHANAAAGRPMFGFDAGGAPDSAPGERKSRRATILRYVAVLATFAVVAEGLRLVSLDPRWLGLSTLAAALVCSWWGGIGPAACIPVVLFLLSRLHPDPARTSYWPTLGEGIVYCFLWLMLLSTGAAGQYRRRIQAITREHSQRLQNHSRALNRAHIIFRDLDGRISEWSDGVLSLFGWNRDEAIGRNIHELLKSQFLEPLDAIRDELLRTGEWQGEILQQHKNGSVLNIAAHWILYRDPTGQPIGIAEVSNDVTDLRRAEAAVREADRRKEEFLATLAHELRNPLAPISNSLQIMRLSDELSPSLQHVREIMEQQVGHMVRLVDDLLDVSRITRGKITLRKERTLLAGVVANAVETVRGQLEEQKLDLSVSLPTEPIHLDADPVRLTQVIANLLGNAAKYTDAGGHIWISAAPRGDELVLSVRDTGEGIPREMLDQIFEMFSQADRTLTRSRGGLGIGLTLVKRLVELHGGSIRADSEGSGKGSVFTIRLPYQHDPRYEEHAAPGANASKSPLEKRQALVVDDTPAAGFILCKLIEKLGHSVELAGSGDAALELIAKKRPDIIFSDIAMPGMHGYELAQRVRQDSNFNETVLVAVTGFGQPSDKARAAEAGFDHHLVKPVSLNDIRDLLASLPRAGQERAEHERSRT
jgi:PAS domain S-box-containing protein